MGTNFTPAPWAVQMAEECTGRQLDPLVKWVVTAKEHDLWISTGPTWDAEHSAESIANARLIASAPELLNALAALLSRAKEELIDPIDVWEVGMAENAIRKAIGESP
jgi:hypothetical protein